MHFPWDLDTKTSIVQVSEADYDAGRNKFMGAHLLDVFADSPRLCQWKMAGLIPSSDSPALAFGRAAHKLILEGDEAFRKSYEVADGPINSRTGKPFGTDTQAYMTWYQEVRATGREIISQAQYDVLGLMLDSLSECPKANQYLAQGQPEVAIRGKLYGVQCQSRLDWWDSQAGVLLDLKTCDNIDSFSRDLFFRGYDRQMAFYRKMLQGTGVEKVSVRILAMEKKEPYRCGIFKLIPATLDTAEAQIMKRMGQFRHVQQTYGSDPWPRSLVYGEVELEV